jgi:hypothetical protein
VFVVLTIRAEQLRILEEDQLRRFEDEMAGHLRARFPACAVANEDRLRSQVVEGMRLARTFHITAEFDVRRFLEFRAEYGIDFHTRPWAAKILNDPFLSGCGKMENLDNYSLFVLRPDRSA